MQAKSVKDTLMRDGIYKVDFQSEFDQIVTRRISISANSPF